jgi:hypothetical protein
LVRVWELCRDHYSRQLKSRDRVNGTWTSWAVMGHEAHLKNAKAQERLASQCQGRVREKWLCCSWLRDSVRATSTLPNPWPTEGQECQLKG